MTIEQIVKELKDLKSKAEYNSNIITSDGYEYTDAERAKSAGYAAGYGFAIYRLENYLLEHSNDGR